MYSLSHAYLKQIITLCNFRSKGYHSTDHHPITTMAISVLSPAERDFVVTGLAQTPPSRLDGRDLLTPRPISISYAEAPQASGSSRVLIGGTQVVAGIRLEVGDVDPSAPKGKEGWRGKVEVDVYVKLSMNQALADGQNAPGIPSYEHAEPFDFVDSTGKCYFGTFHAICTCYTDSSPYQVGGFYLRKPKY